MARLALLSVSNKEGIEPLARALVERHGFQLLSSGGTAKCLADAGLPVTKVAEHTGAPEILGGRGQDPAHASTAASWAAPASRPTRPTWRPRTSLPSSWWW